MSYFLRRIAESLLLLGSGVSPIPVKRRLDSFAFNEDEGKRLDSFDRKRILSASASTPLLGAVAAANAVDDLAYRATRRLEGNGQVTRDALKALPGGLNLVNSLEGELKEISINSRPLNLATAIAAAASIIGEEEVIENEFYDRVKNALLATRPISIRWNQNASKEVRICTRQNCVYI